MTTSSGDQKIGSENDSIPLQSRDAKVPAVEREKCEKFHIRNIGKNNKENSSSMVEDDAILTESIQPKNTPKNLPSTQHSFDDKTNLHNPSNLVNDPNRFKVSVENRLTRISLGIVYLFIICHVWRLIPTVYEALFSEDGTVITNWPKWLLHVYHLSHTLIVFNSAVNFILYVVR